MLEILKQQQVRGITKQIEPIIRISWQPPIKWIIIPEHKNNNDLNIAWDNKWKKAISTKPINKHLIIKPNWLKVDNAIILFKSNS